MDDNRVRSLGLLGGGGALIVALAVAALGGPEEAPPAKAPATVGAVVATPSASVAAPIPPPNVDTAMVDPPSRPVAIPRNPAPPGQVDATPRNPDLEFIVRFKDNHPLSRAQALAEQGARAQAEASARETLARRSDLTGLCFRRFTLGAEIVLAHCAAVPPAKIADTSDRWVRRLKAMAGVQYADANVVLTPDAKAPR
ncbi:MAG: hypothetical protein NW200_08220 [Hyphomonadaceae bacterium]|nr:hypothetical protein [Hyphomonadaceae bacterium]